MQVSDFSADSPGRLVPLAHGCSAFVPDPLPRSFALDGKTQHLLGEAENSLGRLDGVTSQLINPYLVSSPLLRTEAILSSRIEGTYTSAEDMVIVEAAGEDTVPLKSRLEDTREVINYVSAMEHGLKRLTELPVCLRLIREMHAQLLKSVRGSEERPGDFRSDQNFIGNREQGITAARFVPPPVHEMHVCLNDLERYLNDAPEEIPLLVQLALTHYQFEAIHPFRDGNGRLGRLLLPLLLVSRGRLPRPVLYMSSYFERNNDEYRDLLLRVSQKGDFIAWIRFFLTGVATNSREAVRVSQGLQRLHDAYLQRCRKARSSALLQILVDELFRTPWTSFKSAAALLEVTEAAAAANVRKLQEAGILFEVPNRKRNRIFLAREIVEFTETREGTTA